MDAEIREIAVIIIIVVTTIIVDITIIMIVTAMSGIPAVAREGRLLTVTECRT